ncbi:MAG TPA: tripartite tricarboxylate transporter TctB family protein [Halanaerobiales bacterium]|nr:tripartite tricarboxylate transporter TctB family protein [Halanaerobiales bacterium]
MKKLIKNSLFVQGLIFLIFSIFIINRAYNMRDFGESFLSPGIFPALFGGVLLILSLNLIIRGYKEVKKSGKNINYDNIDKVSLLNVIFIVMISLIYLWALSYLGFIISSIVYLFIFMFYIGERRIWILIAISILTPLISYLIFSIGLGISLP